MTENERYSKPFTMTGRQVVKCASCSTRASAVVVDVVDIDAHEKTTHSDAAPCVAEMLSDAQNAAIAAGRNDEARTWERIAVQLRDTDELRKLSASELCAGDYIVNLGTVDMPPRRDGVFVVVELCGITWSHVSGKCIETRELRTYHTTDEITVDTTGRE